MAGQGSKALQRQAPCRQMGEAGRDPLRPQMTLRVTAPQPQKLCRQTGSRRHRKAPPRQPQTWRRMTALLRALRRQIQGRTLPRRPWRGAGVHGAAAAGARRAVGEHCAAGWLCYGRRWGRFYCRKAPLWRLDGPAAAAVHGARVDGVATGAMQIHAAVRETPLEASGQSATGREAVDGRRPPLRTVAVDPTVAHSSAAGGDVWPAGQKEGGGGVVTPSDAD